MLYTYTLIAMQGHHTKQNTMLYIIRYDSIVIIYDKSAIEPYKNRVFPPDWRMLKRSRRVLIFL